MAFRSSIMVRIAAPLRAVLDWVYPIGCVICGRECSPALPLCTTCRRRLPFFPDPLCPVCGEFATPGRTHDDCESHAFGGLTRLWFAGLFDDGYRLLVHALKYERQLSLGEFMGRRLGRRILHHFAAGESSPLIVPVPLHPRRHKERSYNQSAVIAAGLGRVTGIPIAEDVLTRVRKTKDQTKLSPRERVANVRGAFAVRQARRISGRYIVLVDDVMTTGATLNECARVIHPASPSGVGAAVIALARPPGTN